MTSENLLRFLREWSTELNTHCKAGALVEIYNDAYIVRIKNKAFTPFVACFSIDKNGRIQIRAAEAFDYQKSIKAIIYDLGETYKLDNYRFCMLELSGSPSTMRSLLSAILATAANHFFTQSKMDIQKLPTLKICH